MTETHPLKTPASWCLVALAPRVVQDGARLQFDLALESSTGATLFTMKGWSVYKGRVYPPSRFAGGKWIPIAIWGVPHDQKPEAYLSALLGPWRKVFLDAPFWISEKGEKDA